MDRLALQIYITELSITEKKHIGNVVEYEIHKNTVYKYLK